MSAPHTGGGAANGPRGWRALFAEPAGLLCDAWRLLRSRPALWLVLLVPLVLAVALLPHDRTMHLWVLARREEEWLVWAKRLRAWGAGWDTAVFAGLALLLGSVCGRRRWRGAALAMVLAVACAGLAANAVRVVAGRSRPLLEDSRFHGPSLRYDRQGFPSGHTSSAVAGAAALGIAAPVFALPAAFSAAGVTWASGYTRNHYPGDLAAGAGIGAFFGALFGLAARQRYGITRGA